jgi:Tfp pilus assembly protein PilF
MTPAHYFMALAYLDLNQDQAAMAELETATRSQLVTPEMYTAMASIYIRKQQFAEAEAVCRKAIGLDPSRPDGWLTLARVYNGRHASEKALEALRSALPEGKQFTVSGYYQDLQADVAVERAVAYTDRKLYAQAIAEYERALEVDPRRSALHLRLAELYRQTGDLTRAAHHSEVGLAGQGAK